MSTRTTIACGDDFHFYHEASDDDHVYLELETTQYAAGYGRVMLPIPIHIWETIRHLGGVELDLADACDEALQARVERAVEERIGRYQQAVREGRDSMLLVLMGLQPYGSPELPRDEQIRRGRRYFEGQRRWQQAARDRITQLRRENARSQE
jgi:hypothetical protein